MSALPIFKDRAHAGSVLAQRVRASVEVSDAVVLALPRGGVPVGFEVAHTLGLELDIFLVRKLGLPSQPELAIGAIASGGIRVLNQELVDDLRLSPSVVEAITCREVAELERREELYRGSRTAVPVKDRTVILVDDGLATGSSMTAAASAVRVKSPERIIAAVPVAAREVCDPVRLSVDQAICAATPDPFKAVGFWYRDFAQVSEDEVRELLERARSEQRSSGLRSYN